MNIFLNGSPYETNAGNLKQLCSHLGYKETEIATAINGEFIPRVARVETRINHDDKVEILSPRQGG